MRRLLSLREPVHIDLVVVPDAAFVLVKCHRLLHMWNLLRYFVGESKGFGGNCLLWGDCRCPLEVPTG